MDMQLPDPALKGYKSLEECIYERKSVRNFTEREIDLEKISQILWAAQGKKGSKRTVPSAGATYPLDIYITLKNKGFFRYNFEKHLIEKFTDHNPSENIAKASWNQNFIFEAPSNIIICADFSRTTQRYGERGIRYVLIEIGHCAQNVHLEAVACGLGSVPIGAFDDNKVKQVLKLPENINPIYIIPIGYNK